MKTVLKLLTITAFAVFFGIHTLYATITPVENKTTSLYHINKNFDLVPNDIHGNRKVILITIDDGPSKRASDMMKTLTKHNAKALFFVNGIHSKDVPDMIAQEARDGFTVGNHTWSHDNLKLEKNKNKIVKEIEDNSALITKLTGSAPRFFRPPYGASSQYVRDLVKKDNMIFMNWSGAALDWEKSTQNEKVFLQNVLGSLHDGEILLIHEHPWTVKYLDDLLTALEQKGYTILDPSQITN